MVNTMSMLEVCRKIIKHYGLEEYVDHQAITHGLTHTSFKLSTTNGSYIMKCLHRTMPYAISAMNYIEYYQESYEISKRLTEIGIPAVVPYAVTGDLVCNKYSVGIAVFDWVKGDRLHTTEVSVTKAYIIGKLLAEIHKSEVCKISSDRVMPFLEAISRKKWSLLMGKVKKKQYPFTVELLRSIPFWLERVSEYSRNHYLLQQHLVPGHNDLIPANVIWQDVKPYIVDWDLVGWVNPMQELITTGFAWSGIWSQQFNQAVLQAMVQSYIEQGGVITSDISFVLDSIVVRLLTQLQFRLNQLFSHSQPHEKNHFLEQKIIQLMATVDFFISQYDFFHQVIESLTFKKNKS